MTEEEKQAILFDRLWIQSYYPPSDASLIEEAVHIEMRKWHISPGECTFNSLMNFINDKFNLSEKESLAVIYNCQMKSAANVDSFARQNAPQFY